MLSFFVLEKRNMKAPKIDKYMRKSVSYIRPSAVIKQLVDLARST